MLAFTADDKWQIGIGDPSIMGWMTVVAYFATALLCWRCASITRRLSSDQSVSRRSSLFWFLLAGFLFLLGINKQLDLQTWFTLFVKGLALDEGWYEYRQIAQALFILGIALLGLGVLAIVWWLTQGAIRRHRLALLGSFFLGSFILIRASSFHHVDQALGFRLAGLKVNWILELGGVACVAIAAARNLKQSVAPPAPTAATLPLGERAGQVCKENR